MAKANIPIHATILLCSWETKSLHTIFNYVFTYMSNNMIYRKSLAQWFYKVYSDIYGGVTPNLDDIKTEYQMVHLFANIIYVHNTGIRYKTKFKDILHASVLQFYDAFLGVIVNKPSGKYKDCSHHAFHQKYLRTFWTKNSD